MIRVLVVDDHAVVRAGLEQLILTAADIEVVGIAADGAQAVEIARRTTPDIVLMDLPMPVMDGVEATHRITAGVAGVQVVVLTSFSDHQRILDALGAGASGYVSRTPAPTSCSRPSVSLRRAELHSTRRRPGCCWIPATPARLCVAAAVVGHGGGRRDRPGDGRCGNGGDAAIVVGVVVHAVVRARAPPAPVVGTRNGRRHPHRRCRRCGSCLSCRSCLSCGCPWRRCRSWWGRRAAGRPRTSPSSRCRTGRRPG
ncbi:MAG: response regulator transcription factor [Actinomycetota bacterium]|nr:response regulator transcription factor [Actinomycetota bacterium]